MLCLACLHIIAKAELNTKTKKITLPPENIISMSDFYLSQARQIQLKKIVCKIEKNISCKLYHDQRAISVDSDEAAHYEPPHLALFCIFNYSRTSMA